MLIAMCEVPTYNSWWLLNNVHVSTRPPTAVTRRCHHTAGSSPAGCMYLVKGTHVLCPSTARRYWRDCRYCRYCRTVDVCSVVKCNTTIAAALDQTHQTPVKPILMRLFQVGNYSTNLFLEGNRPWVSDWQWEWEYCWWPFFSKIFFILTGIIGLVGGWWRWSMLLDVTTSCITYKDNNDQYPTPAMRPPPNNAMPFKHNITHIYYLNSSHQ